MLLDGEAVENLVPLRHDRQALPHDLVGIAPGSLAARTPYLLSVEKDRTALPACQAGDRIKERRLSMPVQANDANSFARMDHQV